MTIIANIALFAQSPHKQHHYLKIRYSINCVATLNYVLFNYKDHPRFYDNNKIMTDIYVTVCMYFKYTCLLWNFVH